MGTPVAELQHVIALPRYAPRLPLLHRFTPAHPEQQCTHRQAARLSNQCWPSGTTGIKTAMLAIARSPSKRAPCTDLHNESVRTLGLLARYEHP